MPDVPATLGPPPLTADSLYHRCSAQDFPFSTTDELPPVPETLGQGRALEAVSFGAAVGGAPYHVYAMGRPGTGRHFAVRALLEARAAGEPAAPDWCYVARFDDESQPRALKLPAGRGGQLRHRLKEMLQQLRPALASALESDEFRARKDAMETEVRRPQQDAFEELRKEAEAASMAVVRTPAGFTVAPVRDNEPLAPDEYRKLPAEERDRLDKEMERFNDRLQTILQRAPQIERRRRERLQELVEEVCTRVVQVAVEPVKREFSDLPEVLGFLQEMQQDVVNHAEELLSPSESHGGEPTGLGLARRYRVNLLVDNAHLRNAPVIYEDDPRHARLVGTVEHVSVMGTLMTDFTLLKAGALHRANGGYLLLDARHVLMQPLAWEALKRSLRSRQVQVESLSEALGLSGAQSLRAAPIPLDVKVVLFGDRLLYHLLCEYDPDFLELFKVAAEFDDEVAWTPENAALYAQLVGTLVRRDALRPLDRTAVARVVEHAARLAEDEQRLSVHMRSLVDLLRESDQVAADKGARVVTRVHVQAALDARRRWSARIPERVVEQIQRGTLVVETRGSRVGQVNGLSVIQLGGSAFGRPTRITARTRLGRGQIVDIEREAELAGPIYRKGVLILAAYVGARYAPDRPLSLSASLVFEQSYSGIEGDSASVAELCALLSAVSGVALTQELAVTGSISQHGAVQAIGGVNEKVEGFFDVCNAVGLTGNQGVVIPRANVQHLMLRDDVVEAVRQGRFRLHAVETVDQALELLGGLPAGERDADGHFPADTFNARVAQALQRLGDLARKYAYGPGEGPLSEERPRPGNGKALA